MKHLSSYLVQGLSVVAVVAIVMSVGVEWWSKSVQTDTQGRALGAKSYTRCPRCTGRWYEASEFWHCTACRHLVFKPDTFLSSDAQLKVLSEAESHTRLDSK